MQKAPQEISYNCSITTPIRELIVNAVKATKEEENRTGVRLEKVKVELTYGGKLSSNYCQPDSTDQGLNDRQVPDMEATITDHGCGMSEDFVKNKLKPMISATEDRGEFIYNEDGVIAKSIHAIAPTVVWRTTKDGITTTLVSSNGGEKSLISSETTGESNGTMVSFPIYAHNAWGIRNELISEYLDYANPYQVEVYDNGQDKIEVGEKKCYDMEIGDVKLEEFLDYGYSQVLDEDVTILSHYGVPYRYCVDGLHEIVEDILSYNDVFRFKFGHPIIRMDIDQEDISTNYEDLVESPKLDNRVIEHVINYYKNNLRKLCDIIRGAETNSEWAGAVCKLMNSDDSFIEFKAKSVDQDSIRKLLEIEETIDNNIAMYQS